MSNSYINISQKNYIPQLSIDCVIFGYQSGNIKVLVSKLNFRGDFWCLPSGFIYQDEDLDAAAQRILEDRTQIKNIYLKQFYVFGKSNRINSVFINSLLEQNPQLQGSPEEFAWFVRRFISVGYFALVNMEKVIPQKTELDEKMEWVDIYDLPNLIMDGKEIIAEALQSLRRNFDDQMVGYNLLPETFTMKDLQQLYETIFDKPFRRNNFQKMMLDLNILDRLEKQFTGGAHKAPYLYRFKER
ncbi:NUDIX hydrolase [Aquirufa rosea]|uniref:NUDIX hydrolase n=1 Tax=Aquirufa rosea TaxID=2509241 RepID=A0A4Q1C0X6_9BACT|nr:NUDIX domain-containing protein [Aquirufa rosea]RXK50680.1 NUDIX hydrolase [Aquirufa rosea]